jgi:hypothetical protein
MGFKKGHYYTSKAYSSNFSEPRKCLDVLHKEDDMQGFFITPVDGKQADSWWFVDKSKWKDVTLRVLLGKLAAKIGGLKWQ